MQQVIECENKIKERASVSRARPDNKALSQKSNVERKRPSTTLAGQSALQSIPSGSRRFYQSCIPTIARNGMAAPILQLPLGPRLFLNPKSPSSFLEAPTARKRLDICRQSFAYRKGRSLLTTSQRHSLEPHLKGRVHLDFG